MTGLEKDVLQNGLCDGCGNGLVPVLTYAVNTGAKTVTVTDASTFGAGDDLNVVNVSVYDKDGKEKHGQITVDAGNVVIDVTGMNLSSLDIKATVVSTQGAKADLGIYNIGSVAASGNFIYANDQGNRN